MGLLPMVPILALIASGRLLVRVVSESGRVVQARWGVALGFGTALLITLPIMATAIGLHLTTLDSDVATKRGLWLLRNLGSEAALLRNCYGAPRDCRCSRKCTRPAGFASRRPKKHARHSTSPPAKPPPAGKRRVPRPGCGMCSAGTDAVGTRIAGLSLVSSRIEGSSDLASVSAYSEWTLVFKNGETWRAREARAQIALPAGAVVSRLTLWINGVEQEAAFGGRSQTLSAYREIVQQDRDPVIVTTSGRDRVLMQCFPVPPEGGEMKVRLGITAPLELDERGGAAMRLPAIVEQNFASEDIVHAVRFDGKAVELTDAQLADHTAGALVLAGEAGLNQSPSLPDFR
jgi:hypothetical protein